MRQVVSSILDFARPTVWTLHYQLVDRRTRIIDQLHDPRFEERIITVAEPSANQAFVLLGSGLDERLPKLPVVIQRNDSCVRVLRPVEDFKCLCDNQKRQLWIHVVSITWPEEQVEGIPKIA